MAPLLSELLAQAALCALVVGVCAAVARPADWRWLAAFVLLMAADGVVLTAPGWLHLRVGHWNWTGKILSILLGLGAAAACRLHRSEVGLRLPTGRRAWAWSAVGVLAAITFSVAVNFSVRDHAPPDAEALAFQALMPGLDEELIFRGVGLAMLARGYGGARTWPGVAVTMVVFGLVHTTALDHGRLHVNIMPLLYVLPVGLLLAVLRVRSRSLLGPLLAHNLSNTVGSWVSGLP